MRKPAMKRRGGIDLVIAFGGPKKPTPARQMDMEEEDGEEEGYEEGESYSGDHEERMAQCEDRISRLEQKIAKLMGEEEGEEESEDEEYA